MSGDDGIGYCEKKNRMNMGLIICGYRDRTVRICVPNSVRVLFVVLDEEKFTIERWAHQTNCSLVV